MHTAAVLVLAAALTLSACNPGGGTADIRTDYWTDHRKVDPYPSTYVPYASDTVLIAGATILTGIGARINNGSLLLRQGKIDQIGSAGTVSAPPDAERLDATGKWITPGVIDVHSHLGVYPSPTMWAGHDSNEATSPNTAEVWVEHSVWPQDPGFTRALAGGVTTLQILPGSANLFGGRSVILKNIPARSVQAMKFPGAPYGLKMACGENPKGVYGDKNGPATRMGIFARFRAAWIAAIEYDRSWENYEREKGGTRKAGSGPPVPPRRSLEMETLAGVLNGDIRVNMHCYRADEMVHAIDMAKEFGFRIASFHHAVEAYKVADLLSRNGICAAVWSDSWGFKLEAYDAIPGNAALVHAQPGGCAIMHSDSETRIQRLNQEAAKAMAAGRRAGFDIKPEEAIMWITANPAKAMGILEYTGTLEPGKMADVVVWDRNPFSVYAKVQQVYIDGSLMFDRSDPLRSPRTDFEIGQHGNGYRGGAGQ